MLNEKDYKVILEYYNIPIPKNKKQLKMKARKILDNDLCKVYCSTNLLLRLNFPTFSKIQSI